MGTPKCTTISRLIWNRPSFWVVRYTQLLGAPNNIFPSEFCRKSSIKLTISIFGDGNPRRLSDFEKIEPILATKQLQALHASVFEPSMRSYEIQIQNHSRSGQRSEGRWHPMAAQHYCHGLAITAHLGSFLVILNVWELKNMHQWLTGNHAK